MMFHSVMQKELKGGDSFCIVSTKLCFHQATFNYRRVISSVKFTQLTWYNLLVHQAIVDDVNTSAKVTWINFDDLALP